MMAAPGAVETRFGPGAPSGRLVLQPQGAVMIAWDFPTPPEGRIYELWLFTAGKPAPIAAGVLVPDESGNLLHMWKEPVNVASITSISVSDEPTGGGPLPTGKVLFSAPVKK